MASISTFFTSLIAEAIGLPSTAFDRFFDPDQQHKLKIVKYPEVDATAEEDRQGVGPHKDSMLTSYLLQASSQRGLQAQNANGDWIDCAPVPGTLVVAIGQGMQALTAGVCQSTTHRVLSPAKGEGPRYSIPFFQGVSYDARFEEMDVPAEVLALAEEVRARRTKKDDVDFAFVKGRWGHLGEATLVNRVRSHPDVGERWVSCGLSSGFRLAICLALVSRSGGESTSLREFGVGESESCRAVSSSVIACRCLRALRSAKKLALETLPLIHVILCVRKNVVQG